MSRSDFVYDARVTLAQRLSLAIGIVTVLCIVALSLGVRQAWSQAEEERFREQGLAAFERAQAEIQSQVRQLPDLIGPLCAHDPVVDSALVGLQSGDLDSRRLSLSVRTPELMKALRLDELVLLTSAGEILGSGHDEGTVGSRAPERARSMAGEVGSRLRLTEPLAVESWCVRPSPRDAKLWVGLYAARHVGPTIESVARAHGLSLSLSPPQGADSSLVIERRISDLDATLYATASRVPLANALARLDSTLIAVGAGTLLLALLAGLVLSRGLAQPIVSLAREAREVVRGEPKPVTTRGGRELRALAEAFNQAIADLTGLRKRLAATERIAARREIARRVAHEIKNPLAPIRAAVETLRRLRARNDPAFDEYFDEATHTVLEEVTRINNIVTEFTRFARLPPPNPELMDSEEVVRRVVGLHANSGAKLELEVRPVPKIHADRDQLVQVLTNLIQNAIDAASSRPGPTVWVSLGPFGDARVRFVVSDNGPGVAPEMRDRLFEPYATTKDTGTGLGLAIVQRIVVEHGGEIHYADRPAGGAKFSVVLPVSGPTLLPEAPPVTKTGT